MSKMMNKVTNFLLIVLLVCFFAAGITKVSERVNVNVSHYHRQFFERVTDLWQHKVFYHMNITVNAWMFRNIVGYSEVVLSLGLLLNAYRRIAVVLLAVIMCGAIATHTWLEESIDLPFTLLLCCIFVFFTTRPVLLHTRNLKKS
jgi:uncharacterized membrane protein YphA (DoxX/SURF4 family)